jgi:hypothetical protein
LRYAQPRQLKAGILDAAAYHIRLLRQLFVVLFDRTAIGRHQAFYFVQLHIVACLDDQRARPLGDVGHSPIFCLCSIPIPKQEPSRDLSWVGFDDLSAWVGINS